MPENVSFDNMPGTALLKWWMRIVGAFYLLLFVASAIIRLPIQILGPEGTLALNASGNEFAKFIVDTWVILGLALAAMGIGLLIGSRAPTPARALVWQAIGFELIWGLMSDVYQLARGYAFHDILIWIFIHIVIISTGFLILRKTRNRGQAQLSD